MCCDAFPRETGEIFFFVLENFDNRQFISYIRVRWRRIALSRANVIHTGKRINNYKKKKSIKRQTSLYASV